MIEKVECPYCGKDINVDTDDWYDEDEVYEPLQVSARLNKVLASGKEFLIITESEPYYMDVYMVIRSTERKQGTWTPEDEDRYVIALEKELRKSQ